MLVHQMPWVIPHLEISQSLAQVLCGYPSRKLALDKDTRQQRACMVMMHAPCCRGTAALHVHHGEPASTCSAAAAQAARAAAGLRGKRTQRHVPHNHSGVSAACAAHHPNGENRGIGPGAPACHVRRSHPSTILPCRSRLAYGTMVCTAAMGLQAHTHHMLANILAASLNPNPDAPDTSVQPSAPSARQVATCLCALRRP